MRAAASRSAPVAAARPSLAAFYDDLLGRLSDFWFGMSLLAMWGALTLIGVVVDQGKDPGFYTANYAPALARLVLRLHLDNIYHSPGYIGIVGFIVACMTLATFRRVIPERLPPLRPVKIDAIPLHAAVSVSGDERSVREGVAAFFRGRGWLVRERDIDGTEWTFADKYNWARKGVLIAHVGFVLIACGTTLYWAFGFSGETAIDTGSRVTVPRSGATLRLDRFRYRIDPIMTRSGIIYQPIDYVSDLEVTGKDGIARKRTLRVNEPLNIDGTLFYQASYGFAVPFTVSKDGRNLANVPAAPLKEGEGFALGDTARSIQYAKFVGTIGPGGSIGADPRPNNPGVLLSIFDGDQNIGGIVVPLGKTLDLGAGYVVSVGAYRLYSGLQYRHDPGIPFVGTGAFVLLLGLCMSFYFLPARVYVRIAGSGRDWNVGIAATTVKGFEIYEEQFAALVAALRSNEGAPADIAFGAAAPWPANGVTFMTTDQVLIVIAISAYIMSALGLFTYFLSRERLPKTIGIPFAFLGCAVQFFELGYRYETSHIWPLTNLYGSLSLFSAMSVAIFLGFALKYDIWFVGGFVLTLAACFLSYALTWNEGYLPAVPALQSYWIKIHVPLVVSSYAAFAVAFATSLVYLIKYYGERSLELRSSGLKLSAAVASGPPLGASLPMVAYAEPGALTPAGDGLPAAGAAAQGGALAPWLATLPSLAKLDIMTYRVVAVGLPLLTLGVITGAWWAKEAWGAYWQWDPKETAALFSWTVYALYMHLHTRRAWRGLRSAYLCVFGFATIIFCYLGVNIWISGLHSYKM